MIEINVRKNIFWTILFCGVVVLLYIWNFYPQSGIVDEYSDTRYHAEWSKGIINGNNYPDKIKSYPIFFLISGALGKIFSNYNVGITVAGIVFGIATFVTQIFFLQYYLKAYRVSYLKILILSFALNFIYPIDLTLAVISKRISLATFHARAFSTAPAHNLTALSVKACSLICVWLFIEIFKNYNIRKLLVLSLTLLLSVMLKPSFYQWFSFCGAIYTGVYLLMNFDMKRLKESVYMGLAFVPATAWVIYGMNNNMGGFAVDPFVSIFLNCNYWYEVGLSMLEGVFFCVIASAFALEKKEFTNDLMLAWGGYGIALLEYLLMVEPGEIGSLNLSWGYMSAMYILFAFCVVKFEILYQEAKINKKVYIVGNAVYLCHAFMGIYAYVFYADYYRNVMLHVS